MMKEENSKSTLSNNETKLNSPKNSVYAQSTLNQFIQNNEVNSAIEKFKSINKIIEANIGNEYEKYNLNTNDLNNFKNLIKNIEFNKENLIYIINMKNKLKLVEGDENFTEEDKNFITKTFLFLISYLIDFSPQIKQKNFKFIEYFLLLLKLFKKLLKDGYIEIEEISLIAKFITILSLFSNIFKENAERNAKNIKNVLLIWLMLSFLVPIFENNSEIDEVKANSLISDMIDFIDDKILNNLNIFILKDSLQFMSLLEILKNQKVNQVNRQKIMKAVIKVYGNSFDVNFFNFLFRGVKDSFVNLTKYHSGFINTNQADLESDSDSFNSILQNDLQNLHNISDFLKFCLFNEKEKLQSDPYAISRGFLMNSSINTGITLSPIISFPKKGYSLIFSFKWSPNNLTRKNRMNLISFVKDKDPSKDEDTLLMSVFIENEKIYIQIKEIWDTGITINPNQSYLVSIIQVEPGFFSRNKSKISVIVNNNTIKSQEILGYPSGKMKCEIGFLSQLDNTGSKGFNEFSTFSGMIGTVILFMDIFNMETLNRIYELKGEYELILFKNYEFHQPMLNTRLEEIMKYIKKNDKYNYEANICMIISSRSILKSSVVTSSKNNTYKENYREFLGNKTIMMLDRKFSINPGVITFENKNFTEEFLKFDGLKFLSLFMVNLSQIPMKEIKRDDILWNKMSSLIVNVIENILILLDTANLEYYSAQFDFYFYYMSLLFQQGTLFNTVMKCISSMDMNSEIGYFLILRNKLWDLFLNKKFYDEADNLSLQSILAIFYSSIKHNSAGLLNSKFLFKILDFNFIYNINFWRTEEYADVKRAYSYLLFNFVSFSLEKQKQCVIKDYLLYIMREENRESNNIYLLYKMLKFLYFSNSKALLESGKDGEPVNLNLFCIDLIEKFEQINYVPNIQQNFSNQEEISTIELIKALCIRFIDDFYIKYQNDALNINQSNNNVRDSPDDSKLRKQSQISKTKKKSLKQSIKIYKYQMIEKITGILTPSIYTINSLILNIFNLKDFPDNLKFIKKSSIDRLNTTIFSKDALIILIKLFERITTSQSNSYQSKQDEMSVIKYFFTILSKIFINQIQKFCNNKIDKENKRVVKEIFESNKICLKFYFCVCNYFSSKNRVNFSNFSSAKSLISLGNENAINEVNENEDINLIEINLAYGQVNSFDELIKNSLISVITNSINCHLNPFYFNLIFALYCNNETSILIDLYEAILSELINAKEKEFYSKYIISNLKNMLILTYRLIFLKNTKNKKKMFYCQKFEEALISFLNLLSKHQIIYTKISFCIFHNENSFKIEEGKQRTVLEMVFEILLELNKIYNDEKFLDIFENIFITLDHSIFYYLDLFYYFPDNKLKLINDKFDRKTLKKIQTHAMKEGSTNIFMSSYFFLTKILVYILISARRPHDDKRIKRDTLLNKLAELIAKDTFLLITKHNLLNNLTHARIEIKDFLYNENKKLFENSYLKDRNYFDYKLKFDEIIKANNHQWDKYYKMSGYGANVNSILENKMELALNKFEKESNRIYPILTIPNTDHENVLQNLQKSNSSDSIVRNNNLISEVIFGVNLNNQNKPNENINQDINNQYILQTEVNNLNTHGEACDHFGIRRSGVNSDNTRALTTEKKSSKIYVNRNNSLISYHFKKKSKRSNESIIEKFDLSNSQRSMKTSDYKNSSIIFSKRDSTIEKNEEIEGSFKYLISAPDTYELDSFLIPIQVASFIDIIVNKPKKDLLMTTFAIFFRDNYFNDDMFINNIKKKYYYDIICKNEVSTKFEKRKSEEEFQISDEDDPKPLRQTEEVRNNEVDRFSLNYPVKIKNLFTKSYLRLFVKPDSAFYSREKLLKISHNYLKIDDYSKFNFIRLKNIYLQIENSNNVSEFYCEIITIEGVIFGRLYILRDYIQFVSKFDENLYNPKFSKIQYNEKLDFIFSSVDSDIIYEEKEFKIYFKDIEEFLVRRFLLMWQGVEIFLKNGKSYFFNLFRTEHSTKFFKIVSDFGSQSLPNSQINYTVVSDVRKHFKKSDYTKKWLNGKISNLEYLLLINKYSGRSFHDPNQYPIFPWIISKFSSSQIDITDKTIYRNLSYPVSVQSDEKRISAMKKYDDEDNCEKFKVHFRSHYSTSAFVFYYLVRLSPFNYNQIKLQKFKFEHPNRMFHNLRDTWNIFENFSDNRELTPEMYFQPEICLNTNCNYFGVRNSDFRLVNNLILPPWSNNPIGFIFKHRNCLESKLLTINLHNWIDNVFGYSQLNKAKDSLNVFIKYSYEQEINLNKKLEKYEKKRMEESEIVRKIRNKVDLILNFGQTPHKLFEEKHAKKTFDTPEPKSDEFFFLSGVVKAKLRFDPEKLKKGIKYFSYSKSFFYFLNDEREIQIYERQKFKKDKKIRIKHFLYLGTFSAKNLLIYRIKYAITELKDCKFFVSCRHLDNSIKIYQEEGEIKEILTDSFICSVAKNDNEDLLFTGHENGKLIIWKLNYISTKNNQYNINSIQVSQMRHFIAHENTITSIYLNEKLNILITGGEDGYVYIRNLYDYEILSCIKPELTQNDYRSLKIVDLTMSDYDLLYITCFDHGSFILFGYNVNNFKFCQITGMFSNVAVTPGNNLIYSEFDVNGIFIIDPIDFKLVRIKILIKKIFEKKLEDGSNGQVTCFSIIHGNIYLYEKLGNDSLMYGYSDGLLKHTNIEKIKEKEYF